MRQSDIQSFIHLTGLRKLMTVAQPDERSTFQKTEPWRFPINNCIIENYEKALNAHSINKVKAYRSEHLKNDTKVLTDMRDQVETSIAKTLYDIQIMEKQVIQPCLF